MRVIPCPRVSLKGVSARAGLSLTALGTCSPGPQAPGMRRPLCRVPERLKTLEWASAPSHGPLGRVHLGENAPLAGARPETPEQVPLPPPGCLNPLLCPTRGVPGSIRGPHPALGLLPLCPRGGCDGGRERIVTTGPLFALSPPDTSSPSTSLPPAALPGPQAMGAQAWSGPRPARRTWEQSGV